MKFALGFGLLLISLPLLFHFGISLFFDESCSEESGNERIGSLTRIRLIAIVGSFLLATVAIWIMFPL